MAALKCRSCHSSDLAPVLDLGAVPLVNNLLRCRDDECERYPLRVVFCRACTLSQLTETVSPRVLFDDYRYFSAQSQTMLAHAAALVERFVEPGQRVCEIASNDGYLLRHALERGATVLGVDPARNVADHAIASGIPTRCDYFNSAVAQEIARDWGRPDVMFACNVLAHVPDPNEIAEGIARLLAPDGVAHVEVPWIGSLVRDGAFDTIYHEHYSYFSVAALRALFSRHALKMTAIDLMPIHGGSLHIQLRRERGEDAEIEQWLRRERESGLCDGSFASRLADRVALVREGVHDLIHRHGQIGGFGAAAKATVLLNVLGLGRDQVPWVADVSPHKQGWFIPGTLQEVVRPDRLTEAQPRACLIFPWNIADEIARRNPLYLERGGRFFVAVPALREVGAPS